MGCCLRFQNGILQCLECGVWTDVPGQTPGTGGQPGGGTPQPTPNGGTQEYCATLGSMSKWLVPVPVNSGDTILLTNLYGGWQDNRRINWNCPDGWVLVDGDCIETVPSSGSDPVPTSLHMALVGEINGTFYEILNIPLGGTQPTAFTIPAGISNAQMTIQANTDRLDLTNGDVSFCLEYTNNQAGNWQHTFDFTVAAFPADWHPLHDTSTSPADLAVYTPGSGYTDVYTCDVATGMNCERLVDVESTIHAQVTRVQAFFSLTPGTYTQPTSTTGQITINGTHYDVNTYPVIASSPLDTGPISVAATDIQIELASGTSINGTDPGGSVQLSKIIVTGTGVDPYL